MDRLGKRLANSDEASDEDLTRLQQVLAAYDEVKVSVLEDLRQLRYPATGRTKTTGTLIDKLRRHPTMPLSRVQDIAGARLIVTGSRREQDDAVEEIVSWFLAKGCKVQGPVDRRKVPSSGYRAVHVVVVIDGLPAEIQVRTELQDLWAQAYERLGDRWGRAIRYGGEPDDPELIVLPGQPDITRRMVTVAMGRFSDQVDAVERSRLQVLQIKDRLNEYAGQHAGEEGSDELQALRTDLDQAEDQVAVTETALRGTLRLLVQFATEGA